MRNFETGNFLDVDYLRSFGVKPHWFGLGFIQLKLDETYRMHFWHPALSANVPEEELHDHRYDFTSRVLRGRTTHRVFRFDRAEGGDHSMHLVSCKPGDGHEPEFVAAGNVVEAGCYTMEEGSIYRFPHDQFHRIEANECITLVRREAVVKDMARILKPTDEHVCPFSVTMSEDVLWRHIAELVEDRVRLPSGGYHLRPIQKGVVGEVSKIEEEFLEFKDALKQDNPPMAMIELADQIGAIEAWLEKHHPSITLDHLITMKDATRRSFENGHRS